jgi:peptidoglycan/LPS O-acetylase OafA/YrhL
MEENVLSLPPDFKIYKERAIYVGTFLGGPLVAGYLAAENFKKLAQPDKARSAWLIAIASTIALVAIVFLIPNIEKIPSYIIPIIYAGLAQYLVQKNQGAAIKLHVEKGGPVFSVWRAAWLGLIGAAVLFGIIFGILLLTNSELVQ